MHSHNSINNLSELKFGSEITEVTDLNWREEEAHSMIIICMAGNRS
jgi:hypothetical protein